MAVGSLALAGCGRPEVSSYEIPKEKPSVASPHVGMGGKAAGDGTELPPGHPEIGSGGQDAQSGMGMGGSLPPGSAPPSVAKLSWTAPAEWMTGRNSTMRLGSYASRGPNGEEADISITAFPGSVGGTLANLNRWRGQIGLGPIDEKAMPDGLEDLTVAGQPAQMVDYTGPTQRLVAVWLSHEGSTWFFKMTGPPQWVGQNKLAFRDFLSTVAPNPPTE